MDVRNARQRVRRAASEALDNNGGAFEQFQVDAGDFLSAREMGEAVSTRIEAHTVPLDEAQEVLSRSFPERDEGGRFTNVISPVVMPRGRLALWPFIVGFAAIIGLLISLVVLLGTGLNPGMALFGPHLWLLLLVYAGFSWWRRSLVMVPEGSHALITRFGKLEEVAGPGRKTLFSPWKRVSYIVNTTREYPYNAPIREAPTAGRVNASVDLFLQFRIEDPAEFIFALGGVKGFSDKLQNAISEVTRTMIYEQRAEAIYDLVGEDSRVFMEALNQQFLPAVRFMSANITHAEPSSQEYRMDLASPEMVRVAKEAYTYEYELGLKKQQNEGELNRELASLRETLSAIQAEIATYQAQMDTARERETNRANARARQRMVEAESEAKANSALLEAQALDIRAVSGATAPEILEYRFQHEVLDRLEEVAQRLPQVVQIGADGGEAVDFLAIAKRMVGSGDDPLYSAEDMQKIRERIEEIRGRIESREAELADLRKTEQVEEEPEIEVPKAEDEDEKLEEIRQSVADEEIQERVEEISRSGEVDGGPDGEPDGRGNSSGGNA
ncbi:SPFH domain / Band 7 family [Rubrobacter radiotolerans]|uniref:SPFH domain / Band 7 family n=1 Tax=Rubrobacter radiotolerans TaxID=42256 RepID=A0A023WYY9_RUBRA|nr:SPFH domain-containing protein [Rubrobacter radiotolerans]AHY45437.1 SPFH domain / Band 7 family [Rubrobacter radiotolerans]MDX5892848.1 SPFH domain-containing protein [Rubrobacter radiotolerans]SMC02620.1 Regulator of protease activity HflC, stomatin/prohibitin superfamily [Rubrobacter radiotolerans DSM 5868]